MQATLTDAVRPVQRDGAAARPLPARARPALRPDRRRAEPRRARPRIGRSAHDVALDFVDHVRGDAGDRGRVRAAAEALECCSEDPDLVADPRRGGGG